MEKQDGMTRKHFKKCQVHLFKFECSRFFNLKPYGGSFTKSVHFQSMKNQWRFLWKDQVKNFKKVYGVTKCNLKVFLFWWEISLAHIKRGYSGPGNAGGVCSSVAYVISESFLNSQTCYTGWRQWLKTFMPYHAWHFAETMYSIKKEVICICCMYKIFVCTKFMYK